MTGAALFDIDGTLVDSNYLHIDAWGRAVESVGIHVERWRVHDVIGMDSSVLIAELIGEDAAARLSDQITDRHAELYAELTPQLRALPRAQALLRAVADRGVTVVLATSAPPAELDLIGRVLDLADGVAELTNADDVETAKPAPDVVSVALQKAGVDAADAIFVGDTPFDVTAAKKVGVPTIALRSGGRSTAELTGAGAIAVYDDPADLMAHLDESPLARLWS